MMAAIEMTEKQRLAVEGWKARVCRPSATVDVDACVQGNPIGLRDAAIIAFLFGFADCACRQGVTVYFDVSIIRVSALRFETGAAAFRQVGFASHSLPTRAATTSIGGNQ